MVYSIWQTPTGGSKYGIETLLIEVDTKEEAEEIAERHRNLGNNVKVLGPHEPQGEEFPVDPYQGDVDFIEL